MYKRQKYDLSLSERPRWLVLNKIDVWADEEREDNIEALKQRFATEIGLTGPVFAISALDKTGTQPLVWAILEYLEAEWARERDEGGRAGATEG